jgi:hypothetical protein
MAKIRKVNVPTREAYTFFCPGCNEAHLIYTAGSDVPVWSFNGSIEKPTFNPSLLLRGYINDKLPNDVCHSFIKDGNIQFLNDCTHALKGQTVALPDF